MFAGCSTMTVRNWRKGGLLPNTAGPTSGVHLYLRADLQRVMRAPQYKNRGVDYEAFESI